MKKLINLNSLKKGENNLQTDEINRDFKGVWIPKEIYLMDELTWIQKMLLIEIDCYGYWQEISDFCESKGSSYGNLKTLIPEVNHGNNYSSLEQLEVNGQYYNIILWSGATTEEWMDWIPDIEHIKKVEIR